MSADSTPSSTNAGMQPRNRILAALTRDDMERLKGSLEHVPLELRQVIVTPNQPIEHVYFPEDAVISVLGLMEDGSAIETATVGNEGMSGVPAYLGDMRMPAQAFVQVAGSGWRMPAARLAEEVRRGGTLSQLLGRYTQALFALVSQSSACSRKHTLEQRCARWLLMTHDRVEGDTFGLTQLFISQMLGVRRATVSEAATALQAQGLIDYTRGSITVLDRPGLEAASCACYAVIRAEYARLLEGMDVPSPLDGVPVAEDGKTVTGDGAPHSAAERV